MMNGIRFRLAALLVSFCALPLCAEYAPWSILGGLNLIHNADASDLGDTAEVGDPQGLASAPSPIEPFFGLEYRYPLDRQLVLAPSASLYVVRYLWASDRALPAELENRTALVPTLMIDVPVLYTIQRNKFLFSLGGGLSFLLRYAFLEPGVPPDAQNPGELTAAEQVSNINSYLWGSLRWLYPSLQAGIRYELETGWGGGLILRAGLPVFNLWSRPRSSITDSFILSAALTITPPAPVPEQKDAEQAEEQQE